MSKKKNKHKEVVEQVDVEALNAEAAALEELPEADSSPIEDEQEEGEVLPESSAPEVREFTEVAEPKFRGYHPITGKEVWK